LKHSAREQVKQIRQTRLVSRRLSALTGRAQKWLDSLLVSTQVVRKNCRLLQLNGGFATFGQMTVPGPERSFPFS
jgi:hypothetical protein